MPEYLASNDLATFSASGKSTEVYQTTLPSFFAASMSCGVTTAAGGAAERTRVAGSVVAAARAAEAFRSFRRDHVGVFIFKSSQVISFLPPRLDCCQPTSACTRSGGI